MTRLNMLIDQAEYRAAKDLAAIVLPRAPDQTLKLSALTALALAHIGLDETGEALRISREAMSMADEAKDPRMRMLAHRTLALAYLKIGDCEPMACGRCRDLRPHGSFHAKLVGRERVRRQPRSCPEAGAKSARPDDARGRGEIVGPRRCLRGWTVSVLRRGPYQCVSLFWSVVVSSNVGKTGAGNGQSAE